MQGVRHVSLSPQELMAALVEALGNMEVAPEVVERIRTNPNTVALHETGLDSKDLLLLDFQLEEVAGLNIDFDGIRDDTTVAGLLSQLVKHDE